LRLRLGRREEVRQGRQEGRWVLMMGRVMLLVGEVGVVGRSVLRCRGSW
jgi:hypothetical protein